jgi:hypothetical protein
LEEQRRMRVEIADIMRYIYPDLKDYKSVLTYPHIKGISKDLFFFHHVHREETNVGMSSKFNIFEA